MAAGCKVELTGNFFEIYETTCLTGGFGTLPGVFAFDLNWVGFDWLFMFVSKILISFYYFSEDSELFIKEFHLSVCLKSDILILIDKSVILWRY